jgi:hypothetical protein
VLVGEVAGEDEHVARAEHLGQLRGLLRIGRELRGAVAARTWRLTYSDGRSLTQGTSRQMAFQSLSKRHSSGGSHEKPASSRTTRSDGTTLEDALGDEAEQLRLGDDLRIASGSPRSRCG